MNLNRNPKLFTGLLGGIVFLTTLLLYFITSSDKLMFDDAAEFALVIRLGSVAHPPGFPSYIFSGIVWDKVTSFLIHDSIVRLTLFSSILVSTACTLLFFAFRQITKTIAPGTHGWREELSAFFTALAFGLGNTTWLWGNTIEAYPFQIFAMSLVLFGLCHYQTKRNLTSVIIAAVGLALGWSNHHLTMIVFTPFVPLFFMPGLFKRETIEKNKKVKEQPNLLKDYFKVLWTKEFRWFTGISAGLTLSFYGWMMWRAQGIYPFMFGKPENLDLLFYHTNSRNFFTLKLSVKTRVTMLKTCSCVLQL